MRGYSRFADRRIAEPSSTSTLRGVVRALRRSLEEFPHEDHLPSIRRPSDFSFGEGLPHRASSSSFAREQGKGRSLLSSLSSRSCYPISLACFLQTHDHDSISDLFDTRNVVKRCTIWIVSCFAFQTLALPIVQLIPLCVVSSLQYPSSIVRLHRSIPLRATEL